MPTKKRKAIIGDSFVNKYGMKFTIIGYDENDRYTRIIEFENGTIQKANVIYIKDGCDIYDRYNTPTVFGMGINDIENGGNHILYNRWIHMIGRCYNESHPQYKSYGAKGVIVEDYLLRFSNYIAFIESLDNYELLEKYPNDYQIDKDIKNGRKLIYSRETISIVKKEYNLEEENDKKRIPIIRYTLKGEEIDRFESITEASKITGIYRGNIARCIRGKSKTAGGYKWGKLQKN